MTEISDKVLKAIERGHMHPSSRWKFMLPEIGKLALLAAAVVAGSLAVSATFHLFTDFEWEMGVYKSDAWLSIAMRGVPFFWLAVLLAFIIAATLDFSSTAEGYRYRRSAVVGICLAASLVIGSALFASGYGETIDETVATRWPAYRHLVWRKADVWSRPEEGRLGGMIEALRNEPPELLLRDFERRVWLVKFAGPTWPANEHLLRCSSLIRISGYVSGSEFIANEIRPWTGRQPRIPLMGGNPEFVEHRPNAQLIPPPTVIDTPWPPLFIGCPN